MDTEIVTVILREVKSLCEGAGLSESTIKKNSIL
jgi:hypothetical protein